MHPLDRFPAPGRLLEPHVELPQSARRDRAARSAHVLVGPNGAGKSNVLKVFGFLADIIRTDLKPALDAAAGSTRWLSGVGPRRPH
nr:AAA family ATPase [Streptomyces sp. CME 23]